MPLKKGDLVEPTDSIVASYSNYAGRPIMKFEPGMLGAVRYADKQLGGYQVEFFHPASGCMEAAWTTSLKKVKWPEYSGLSPDESQENSDWFCGSLNRRGALALLGAVAKLRPDYFRALHPKTLRIPMVHASRIRRAPEEKPNGITDQRAAKTVERVIAVLIEAP